MRIATQTSHKKRHKVLIAELHNVPIWGAQTSHFRDTNRTSSLFGLSLGLSEESLEASPLRCRAASSPPFKVHGRGFPPSKPSPETPPTTLLSRPSRWPGVKRDPEGCREIQK